MRSGQIRSDQVKSGHIWSVQYMSSQSQIKVNTGQVKDSSGKIRTQSTQVRSCEIMARSGPDRPG